MGAGGRAGAPTLWMGGNTQLAGARLAGRGHSSLHIALSLFTVVAVHTHCTILGWGGGGGRACGRGHVVDGWLATHSLPGQGWLAACALIGCCSDGQKTGRPAQPLAYPIFHKSHFSDFINKTAIKSTAETTARVCTALRYNIMARLVYDTTHTARSDHKHG